MSISVIIPAYNYAHYLPRTLYSVLRQRIDVPVELIVVDDGSTDNTEHVVSRIAGNVTYIRQENQGLSAARNTGLVHASGEALVFLDADDLLMPDMLQSQWDALKANPQAHISVCRNFVFTARQPGDVITVRDCFPLPRGSYAVHLCCHNVAPVHCHMTLRSLAMQAGLFDVELRACEDYDFWLRCMQAGGEMVGNTKGAVLYRRHGESMSAQMGNQVVYEAICNKRIARMLHNTPSFMADRRLDAYLGHLVGTMSRIVLAIENQQQLLVPLLAQGLDAAKRIVELCGETDGSGDMTLLATDRPRTQEEVEVLQYYILRTLLYLRSLQELLPTFDVFLTFIENTFRQWVVPADALEDQVQNLHNTVYHLQFLDEIADADGAMRVRV